MIFIYFIINPISGKGTHGLTTDYINSFFACGQYMIETHFTKYKNHAEELSREAVILNADVVVACGGDGTINEVASALIGTGKKLGIIPLGSGNGLASNLGIPQNIEKALKILRAGTATLIDVGILNKQYFFSNAGVGIDAAIISHYQKRGKRTLLAYIISSLSANIKYKATTAILTIGNEKIKSKPFMLFISNSNEMGYKMSLTPNAKLNDGLLDIVLIPEISVFNKIMLGYLVLCKKIMRFKKAQRFVAEKLVIELPEKIFTDIQLDGEHHSTRANIFEISLLPQALPVIVKSKKI
ncbi:diacylglycerol/lipid kinase family protein [Flavobacterium psychrotrophum]|uniref:diacylglycerol/lipid kinase family protein n=1 Tax=Flavobacterium psychrotrophum TaxID=2294119 RepID=UPI000E31B946|nr:diacylglycerol kinase family protein [Flavobacterium psychrotrophum]